MVVALLNLFFICCSQAMQESQLESLEPQQARLVLGAYSSSLTAEQVEALERSAGPTDGQTGGPTEGPKVTPTSGGNSIFGKTLVDC